jgi:hypothetical protein
MPLRVDSDIPGMTSLAPLENWRMVNTFDPRRYLEDGEANLSAHEAERSEMGCVTGDGGCSSTLYCS